MKNQGFATLEAVVGIIILSLLVFAVSNFTNLTKKHESVVYNQTIFNSHIDSEITSIYSDNTPLENKVVKTKLGDMNVAVEDLGQTEYKTDKFQVTFSLKDFEKTYTVERSQYRE